MNIYYFDPSLNCSLFFISLYLITLYLSLPFSIFTHYPLTHLVPPRNCLFCNSSFLLTSLYFFGLVLFPCCPPLIRLSLCITSTVKIKKYSSKMELICLYSKRSQVRKVEWKHHNESRKLKMSSSSLGSITTSLPLPITSDIAGNYTCVLHLKNGQAIQATQAITVSPKVVQNLSKGWCVF